ncbi:hypothetical protein CALVIDRAFT_538491 [Calocera viscosa TUFC12733]|uniref:Uncharacterized protein n=1 Tax=Calocera viscosa (strain TUFC12733) TaxID=1330018 RepID=A0A167KUF3_CALVF|nr:hypothetical protein CALVIDRAFT_538491 [Calocera viscosa TUFC12733]
MPELSHTPSSGSPPTPARYTPAYAYAYSHPRLHLDMDMDIDRSEALAEHGPETDDGLHESFAARTKAVSYPDLVMLARKRPAPPAARAGAGAGAARGLPGGGMRASRTPQERRRTELVYTRRETSVERRAGWEERGERTELGGLFFDGVSAQEKGEGVAVGGREGWRVWALDRAARAVGLD